MVEGYFTMIDLIHEFSAINSINVPARTGIGFEVNHGQLFRIIDVDGSQPADFWAFNNLDIFEHLSCEHTKPSIQRLYPRKGNSAFTNHRRPIVTLVQDNSPGEHDMEFAACDKYRYLELGADGSHSNCTDNLHKALGGFATNGVNLCKLESFAVKNTFDQVNFYIDIEGHIEDPSLQKALEELGFHTQKLDILGVYEAHQFRFKNK